jgi:ZIP family zinc transporter
VTEAAFWGAIAGSSLVIGALIALLMRPRVRNVGLIMAFGAGTLIAAVAYDLIGESFVEDDSGGVALAFLAGAIVFLIGDTYLSARGAHNRKGMAPAEGDQEEEGSGVPIVLGTILDGVPESFAMGLALIGGADDAVGLIVAVFVSNVPEAIGATSSLQRSGWATSRIMLLWCGIGLISMLSTVLGYAFFNSASGLTGARVEAFAAGAIIAMLATTMMPEANRAAGRVVGVVTAIGFAFGVAVTGA